MKFGQPRVELWSLGPGRVGRTCAASVREEEFIRKSVTEIGDAHEKPSLAYLKTAE